MKQMNCDLYQEIIRQTAYIEEDLIAIRRDLHRHPETGWLEMRTSSIIAMLLTKYGMDEVLVGREVCAEEARMGVPAEEVLKRHYEEVSSDPELPEASRAFLPKMQDGFTGVVGILRCGEGPTVAVRCDIDALPVFESTDPSHAPAALAYASMVPGVMHACGHDGHTTIGLGTARVLAGMKDRLHGTVKFLFQPAEEGVRGAKAMVEAGHLDDVDILLGCHMSGTPDSEPAICINRNDTLATTKLDVTIHGKAAHAGARPDEGRNALLAACTAVQNLHAIPRRHGSITRVNVGTLHAGTGRNVIADRAFFEMEVRGDSTEANNYMYESAMRIIEGAALSQGCTYEVEVRGAAGTCTNTEELIDEVLNVCGKELGLKAVRLPDHGAGASEDFAWMGSCVKEHGGKVCYFRNVSHLPAGIHSTNFDFEECALGNGVKACAGTVVHLLG